MNRYPILDRLPPEEQARIAAKSDAGQPLTPDECQQLGLAPCASLVLTPVEGLNETQLAVVFAGDRAALKDIVRKPSESKVRERERETTRTKGAGANRPIPVLAAHPDRRAARANLSRQQ